MRAWSGKNNNKSVIFYIDFQFKVFGQTSVRDNEVDVSVSKDSGLRAANQERTFGISCVCFVFFEILDWMF